MASARVIEAIYSRLCDLAQAGAPLPINRKLGEGISSRVSWILVDLRRAGRIVIENHPNGGPQRRIQITACGMWTDWSQSQYPSAQADIKPYSLDDDLTRAMRGRRFQDHPNAAPPGPLIKPTPSQYRRSLTGNAGALCAP